MRRLKNKTRPKTFCGSYICQRRLWCCSVWTRNKNTKKAWPSVVCGSDSLGTVFLLFIISSCISAEDTATRLETCETQIQTHVSQCSWTLNESLGVCLRSHFEERAEGSSPGGWGVGEATSEVRTIISIKQGHHCPLHPQVKPKIIRMADV